MARPGGAYSTFVALAKIALPIAALALLATLFLFARRIDPDAAIPFAQVDVEQYAREQRIGTPEFAGVTADGTVISMSADLARPDPETPGRMTAEGLAVDFTAPDGSTVTARAGFGAVDSAAATMMMTGAVWIETSTGYRIEAEGFSAALDVTDIRSDGPVTAEGPGGHIEAGSVRVSQSAADPNAYVLVFNGGVRLVYEPGD